MKVVMLKDVSGVGQKGTVQDVADGYALNRLIPQKLAVIATQESLTALKKEVAAREAQRALMEKEWDQHARLLKDGKVTIRTEANDKGHLYKQLSVSAISERIKQELGVTVEPEAIVVKEPIRSLGRAEITVQLGKRRVPLVVYVENRN